MIAYDLPTEAKRDRMVQKLSLNMMVLKCGKRAIRFRPPLTFSMVDAKKALGFIEKASI